MIPDTITYKVEQHFRDAVLEILDFTTTSEKQRVLVARHGVFYEPDGVTPTDREIVDNTPDPPFLLIQFLVDGEEVGTPSRTVIGSQSTVRYEQPQRSRVQISGFGRPTSEWLSLLGILYGEQTTPLSLVPEGPIQDLSPLVDDERVATRYDREFDLYYVAQVDSDLGYNPASSVEVDAQDIDKDHDIVTITQSV